jgi:hypothetical protein
MGGGMSGLKIEWPCLSKRGLVSTPFGVMYPAPQGIAVIGAGAPEIATREFYTEEEWKSLQPSSFVAAMRDNRYYAGYTTLDGLRRIVIIDKGEVAPITDINLAVDAFWTDPASGKLYVALDDTVHEWDAYVNLQYDWMSKEFVSASPVNMAVAKVDADFALSASEQAALATAQATALAANQALMDDGLVIGGWASAPPGLRSIAGNRLNDIPELSALQFQLYVNNMLVFAKVVLNRKPFKLPASYRADTFAVRIAGEVRINSIAIAETMGALKSV